MFSVVPSEGYSHLKESYPCVLVDLFGLTEKTYQIRDVVLLIKTILLFVLFLMINTFYKCIMQITILSVVQTTTKKMKNILFLKGVFLLGDLLLFINITREEGQHLPIIHLHITREEAMLHRAQFS